MKKSSALNKRKKLQKQEDKAKGITPSRRKTLDLRDTPSYKYYSLFDKGWAVVYIRSKNMTRIPSWQYETIKMFLGVKSY